MALKKKEAAPAAGVPEKRKHVKASDFEFAVFAGSRTPKAFANKIEEVKAAINALPVNKQAKVAVFKKLTVTVKTSLSIGE